MHRTSAHRSRPSSEIRVRVNSNALVEDIRLSPLLHGLGLLRWAMVRGRASDVVIVVCTSPYYYSTYLTLFVSIGPVVCGFLCVANGPTEFLLGGHQGAQMQMIGVEGI